MIVEMTNHSVQFLTDLGKFCISAPILPFVGLFLIFVSFGLFKAVIGR